MPDLTLGLLADASRATQPREFFEAAARRLSGWAGGTAAARVALSYTGPEDGSAVEAVAGPDTPGDRLDLEWRDPDGRRLALHVVGAKHDLPRTQLEAALEATATLAAMVARRTALERERRLGGFLVELSRWLLAAPQMDLLLRYTLQSLMSLLEADGAFVALRPDDGHVLRVVTAIGESRPLQGVELGLDSSVTGRAVRTGEAIVTIDIRAEHDLSPAARALPDTARAAMIAPLHTSTGVVGAAGLVRYQRSAEAAPLPFSLVELHYFTAVAAHIAGGIELSQAVAATRAAADRARAMVEASPLPLGLVDTEGAVLQLNEAAVRVFGLGAAAEAVGRPLDTLGLAAGSLPLRALIAGRREREPWHGRVLVDQPGGERRICDCTITGLTGLGSPDLLVALYDRTDELRAQRELIAREKLATVGEIASGVAHEVNNPLTAIRMEAELLGRSTRDPDAGAAATSIVREVDRAARIVRSLLRLARRADTTPTRIQMNELVRDVAEIRQRVLRTESVEVRVEMDHSAPAVLGLGQELQQVVINLFTNAEHAVRGRRPAIIRLATQARGGWVRLIVEDSGPGIPHEVRHRIFDPFFTTKAPDEGSGLGLSICQRVVSEVGGRIWLEDSAELGGAKFVVELPAAPETIG